MRKVIVRVVVFLLVAYIIVYGSSTVLKEVVFPYEYKNYVDKYSEIYDVDPLMILSVMKAESNFNPNAQSKKDAMGLMQITKTTGAWIAEQQGILDFNTDLLLDPEVNIRFGSWYLDNLYTQFEDWDLVIASYNAGRGNVDKWLNNPENSKDGKVLHYIPFNETDKYLKKVKAYYNIYSTFYGKDK